MATLDFPTSPVLNDTYSFGGKTWVWNGQGWQLQNQGAINGLVIGNTSPAAGTFTTLSATANVTGGNVLTAGLVSATGNIAGNFFIGNGSQLTGLPATYGNANVVANLAALGSNPVSTTGNITAGNLLFGSGITSGTGNITGGNVLTGGLISATSTITSAANITGGNILTSGQVSAAGAVTGGSLSIGTGNTGDAIIYGNLTVYGNTTTINSNTITTNDLNITVGNNQNTGAALNNAGIDVGNNNLATWRYNNTTTSWQSNIAVTPAANATLAFGGTSNYWGTAYLNAAQIATTSSAVGNVTGGNVLTGGLVSAAGNVTGGNVLTSGLISSTSTITSAANITGGNVLTGGLISAASTVTGTSHLGAVVSVTANIIGGNLLTAGLVSATGNITGNYFIGNGSQLTGITASSSAGNLWVVGRLATYYVPILNGILNIVGRTGNISIPIIA